jgi:hypothetical protein
MHFSPENYAIPRTKKTGEIRVSVTVKALLKRNHQRKVYKDSNFFLGTFALRELNDT